MFRDVRPDLARARLLQLQAKLVADGTVDLASDGPSARVTASINNLLHPSGAHFPDAAPRRKAPRERIMANANGRSHSRKWRTVLLSCGSGYQGQ
ncbi:unnamed protein product, partial [Chrysoparadoxa australica]